VHDGHAVAEVVVGVEAVARRDVLREGAEPAHGEPQSRVEPEVLHGVEHGAAQLGVPVGERVVVPAWARGAGGGRQRV